MISSASGIEVSPTIGNALEHPSRGLGHIGHPRAIEVAVVVEHDVDADHGVGPGFRGQIAAIELELNILARAC